MRRKRPTASDNLTKRGGRRQTGGGGRNDSLLSLDDGDGRGSRSGGGSGSGLAGIATSGSGSNLAGPDAAGGGFGDDVDDDVIEDANVPFGSVSGAKATFPDFVASARSVDGVATFANIVLPTDLDPFDGSVYFLRIRDQTPNAPELAACTVALDLLPFGASMVGVDLSRSGRGHGGGGSSGGGGGGGGGGGKGTNNPAARLKQRTRRASSSLGGGTSRRRSGAGK